MRFATGRRPPHRPVDGHLVHRRRAENVLLSAPTMIGDRLRAELVDPPAAHELSRRGRDTRSGEELLEAARQLSILLLHTSDPASAGGRMVMHHLAADLPCSISREWPLALECLPGPFTGRRRELDLRLVGARRGIAPAATVSFSARVVSPAAYERLRGVAS
jgi:hypothetical protein